MSQTFSIWVLIALALIAANLPFLSEKPFLVLPWSQHGESQRSFLSQLLGGCLFLLVLAALVLGVYLFVGQFGSLGLNSQLVLLFKVVVALLLATLVMGFPGWRSRGHKVQKNLFVRLLEVLAFYFLVGALGFAFEAHIGNRFTQGWEFYAITLCLFIVMAYPGFVYRYLMRHPKGKFA